MPLASSACCILIRRLSWARSTSFWVTGAG
jgi:hypothetical protein